MVWFETPSNPLLKIIDVEAVAKISKRHNKDIIIVVDNTFMTPYFQVIDCLYLKNFTKKFY